MDNGELATKLTELIDSLRDELPVMIEAAVSKHEVAYVHMTPDEYDEALGGKTPQEIVEDHTAFEQGQEYMIAQLNDVQSKQLDMATKQEHIALVVLGPESTSYDGEVVRSGGLQGLVIDMNKKGEIKTRLAAKDRVALYVAAIGGLTSVVVATIIAFMA